MPFTWVTIRPGRSTPADLVQSRFSQIGPRLVSELESVLTLVLSEQATSAIYMSLSWLFHSFSVEPTKLLTDAVNSEFCIQKYLQHLWLAVQTVSATITICMDFCLILQYLQQYLLGVD